MARYRLPDGTVLRVISNAPNIQPPKVGFYTGLTTSEIDRHNREAARRNVKRAGLLAKELKSQGRRLEEYVPWL